MFLCFAPVALGKEAPKSSSRFFCWNFVVLWWKILGSMFEHFAPQVLQQFSQHHAFFMFFQTCTILSFLSIWGAANLDRRLFLMIENKISENVNIVWPGVAHHPRVVWFPTSAANGEEGISSAHSKRQSGISISSIGWLGHLVKESWGHVHAFSGSSISEKYFSDSPCFLSHLFICFVSWQCALMRHH